MGGGQLSILVLGGTDLTDSLLSLSEGGSKLTVGLKGRIRDSYGSAVHLSIAHQAVAGSKETLDAVRNWCASAGPESNSPAGVGFETGPDVVVLSLDPRNDVDMDAFGLNTRHVVRFIKDDLQAHVVFYNASTVDHDDLISNYKGVDETLALRIHRLNLALMWLSLEEGISIVDVDRLIADLGAGAHVGAVQDYSTEASGLICDEFIRVVADYGFFEQRPLVAQLGRAAGR